MITENLSTLKIHKLTQEQYDRVVAAGNIDESALYLTPDETKISTGDGESSTVIGTGVATGTNSTVIGTGSATGEGATVIGNGTASGDYSVSYGKDTIAGCRGYYIAAIDPANNYIYLYTGEDAVVPTWDNPSDFYNSTFDSDYKLYLGDVNGDGVLDDEDADLIMKHVADHDLNNFQEEVADVDKNGKISTDDSVMILRYVSGDWPELDFEFVPYGNEFSISSDSYYHWPFAGQIVEISGNRIKYGKNNSLNNTEKWLSNVDNGADPMVFFIPAQSEVGLTNIGTGSHAEGWFSHAAGQHSHAEGYNTIVAGRYGHSEGHTTRAGFAAHAEGQETLASGLYSHAEGRETQAINSASHAEGYDTKAHGMYSHAEGQLSEAVSNWSHAEGYKTIANEDCAHSEGYQSKANGKYSHAEGRFTEANGMYSHSEGQSSKANGSWSHAEGEATVAEGNHQHVQGKYNIKDSTYAHIVGNGNSSTRSNAHTIDWDGNAWYAGSIKIGGTGWDKGAKEVATNDYVDSEIDSVAGRKVTRGGEIFNDYTNNQASNIYCHAEGERTKATGPWSHAEGYSSKATADCSHAEGYTTIASGKYSHAEGRYTESEGLYSHAEGQSSKAIGESSHAEGFNTQAKALRSHAEGYSTVVYETGKYSHAEGFKTEVSGEASHAEGLFTKATVNYQHVQGKYNYIDENGSSGNYAHIVGNGTSNKGSNAHTIDWNGNAWFAGSIRIGGTSQDDPMAKELVTKEYVAELLARIEALEAALNPVNEITFEVEVISDGSGQKYTYKAEQGMTWQQFVASDYNTDGAFTGEERMDDVGFMGKLLCYSTSREEGICAYEEIYADTYYC